MKAEELERIISSAELRNPHVYNASRERYVAEISFEAGCDEGYFKGCAEVADGAIKDRERHHKAGINEAVEWMREQPYASYITGTLSGQAKLKEWGVTRGV